MKSNLRTGISGVVMFIRKSFDTGTFLGHSVLAELEC